MKVASEATQSDSGPRTVTDGAAGQGEAEARGMQQEHDQLLCKESLMSAREAEPAAASPQQPQSVALLADEQLEASGASELQAQSPGPGDVTQQAHLPILQAENAACPAEAEPCSHTSGIPEIARQCNQQGSPPVKEPASAAASVPRLAECGDPGVQADSLSSAPLHRTCDRQQWMTLQDSEPSASTGNPSAAHLPAQAADEDVKPKFCGAIVPAAQPRYGSPSMSIKFS